MRAYIKSNDPIPHAKPKLNKRHTAKGWIVEEQLIQPSHPGIPAFRELYRGEDEAEADSVIAWREGATNQEVCDKLLNDSLSRG